MHWVGMCLKVFLIGRVMSKRGKLIKILVEGLGKRFSSQLRIDLSSGKNEEIFKWFLASILFGARISEAIVVKTYKEFEKEDVVSPSRILKTGWDGLVKILDRGGYVRYDFKTATKLLEVMKNFKDRYINVLTVLTGSDLEM
jgi:hypothetical protein